MIIVIGLFIMVFGLVMFKLYHGFNFHHSIGIPIIVLGLLISAFGIGYKIKENNMPSLKDISVNSIRKIKVDYIYHPADSLNEYRNSIIEKQEDIFTFFNVINNGQKTFQDPQRTEWYIDLIIELYTKNEIYATFFKTNDGF